MKISYFTPAYCIKKNRKDHLTDSKDQLPTVKTVSSLPVGCFSPVAFGVRTAKSDKFKHIAFKGNEEDEKLSNFSGLKAIVRQTTRETLEEEKEEIMTELREEVKTTLRGEFNCFKTEIKQELDNLSTKMTEENKLSAFICQIKADSQNNLLSLIEPYVDEESSIKYHNLVKDHGFISPEIAEFLTEQSDKFSGPDAVLLLNIPELIYKKIITQESKKASPDKTLLSEALDGYETVAEEIWKKTPEGEGPSKKQARILREIKMYKNKFGL